jgi:hypothetical protein
MWREVGHRYWTESSRGRNVSEKEMKKKKLERSIERG